MREHNLIYEPKIAFVFKSLERPFQLRDAVSIQLFVQPTTSWKVLKQLKTYFKAVWN